MSVAITTPRRSANQIPFTSSMHLLPTIVWHDHSCYHEVKGTRVAQRGCSRCLPTVLWQTSLLQLVPFLLPLLPPPLLMPLTSLCASHVCTLHHAQQQPHLTPPPPHS